MQENPFADLIPTANAQAHENPFADLIPKEKGMGEKAMDFGGKAIDYGKYLYEAASKGLRHAVGAPAETLVNPLIDQALGTNLTQQAKQYNQTKDTEFHNKYGNGLVGDTVSNVAEGLPSFLGGVGLSTASRIPQAAQAVSKGLSGLLSKGIGSATKGGLIGAGTAPFMYDPTHSKNANQKLSEGALIGAIANPALQGLGGLAGGLSNVVKNKLNPLRNAQGMNSPAQISEIRQAAGDMPLFAGNVIEDPALRQYQQNVLGKRSSGQNVYKNIYSSLEGKAADVEGGLSSQNDISNIGGQLQNTLKTKYKNAIKIKNNLYDTAKDIAEENNLQFIPKNTAAKANEIINEYEEIFKRRPNAESDYSDFIKRIKDFTSNEPITYSQAQKDRAIINGGFRKADAKSNYSLSKEEKSKLHDLLDAFDKDMLESSKPNPAAHSAFKDATQYYREKIAPFENPKTAEGSLLNKHAVKGKGNEDKLISDFVDATKTDNVSKLRVLTNHLPPEQKDALFYGFVKQQSKHGASDIQNMVLAYAKLGPKQRDLMFEDNPELRKQLNNLELLVKANPEAMGIKYNPKTGYQTAQQLTGTSGAAGFMGGLIAKNLMHHKLALATGGLTALGKYGLDRIAIKNLTSKKAMDEYMERLLGVKKAKQTPSLTGGLISLINQGAQQ